MCSEGPVSGQAGQRVIAVNGRYRVVIGDYGAERVLETFDTREEACAFASLNGPFTAPIDTNLPVQLFWQFADRIRTVHFVETGTAWGNTAEYAALCSVSLAVTTIELDQTRCDVSRRLLKPYKNVQCLLGNSPEVLRTLSLTGRTIFWLDAHYSGEGTALGPRECPVLEELASIRDTFAGKIPLVILIDDARMFRDPSAARWPQDWPNLEDLAAAKPEGMTMWLFRDQIVME